MKTFAVIDTGSNAMRLQVAAVDQPGSYRVIEQERKPVRLGHRVFETGKLDKVSRTEALDTLRRFKAAADRLKCTAVRAVATSAMREASDAASFIHQASEVDVTLEILPEEEEARLISLGIMSGVKFDLPMGLFMDIGGGSVEVGIGNRAKMISMFSLPLGVVRLTERYLAKDPPNEKEIAALRKRAKRLISPVARKVVREKFSMAFGSGGTITALADADARFTGDSHLESFYVLRKARLKGLFNLLISQPSKHTDAIIGDSKRADLLVAGATVLLTLMSKFELDYIFVSRKGLRDGLMVDLLTRSYPKYTGTWTQEETQTESLEDIGAKYNFNKAHCTQVARLAQTLFDQLRDLHKLPGKFADLLHAAAMLHDIGLFVGYPKHHKHTYYLIKSSGADLFEPNELDMIANIARYHRKAAPSSSHLPYSRLSPFQQDVVLKLSAILRFADALDYDHQSKIKDISCKLRSSKKLAVHLTGKGDLTKDIDYALEKSDLMHEVYDIDVVIN